jgi:hypothetical protein
VAGEDRFVQKFGLNSIELALVMLRVVVASGCLARILPLELPLPMAQIGLGAVIAGQIVLNGVVSVLPGILRAAMAAVQQGASRNLSWLPVSTLTVAPAERFRVSFRGRNGLNDEGPTDAGPSRGVRRKIPQKMKTTVG